MCFSTFMCISTRSFASVMESRWFRTSLRRFCKGPFVVIRRGEKRNVSVGFEHLPEILADSLPRPLLSFQGAFGLLDGFPEGRGGDAGQKPQLLLGGVLRNGGEDAGLADGGDVLPVG